MNVATWRDVGPQLVKALGLEGRSVVSIDIRVAVGELIKVTVTENAQTEHAQEAVAIIGEAITQQEFPE